MAKGITEATINDIYPQYKLLRKAKKGFGYPTKEHNAEKAIDQLSLCASQGLNFIAKKDITQDGFLAHEVSGVVPEAVVGEKDGAEMQGIDQAKLVPLLVKTIQELEARIKTLEDA